MRNWLVSLPIIIAVCGVLGFALTTRLYWGYWLVPPRCELTAASIASVERYSSFSWDATSKDGRAALIEDAGWARGGIGESPMGRLSEVLLDRGLTPTTDEAVPPEQLAEILALIGVRGSPSQPVMAHVARGVSESGNPVVVAAIRGIQVSSDHCPYWEVVAAGPSPMRLDRLVYYECDIAGLEGIAPFMGAALAALASFLAWCVVGAAQAIRGKSYRARLNSST